MLNLQKLVRGMLDFLVTQCEGKIWLSLTVSLLCGIGAPASLCISDSDGLRNCKCVGIVTGLLELALGDRNGVTDRKAELVLHRKWWYGFVSRKTCGESILRAHAPACSEAAKIL